MGGVGKATVSRKVSVCLLLWGTCWVLRRGQEHSDYRHPISFMLNNEARVVSLLVVVVGVKKKGEDK